MNLSTTVTLPPGRERVLTAIPGEAHPTRSLALRGGGVTAVGGPVRAPVERTSENRLLETDDWAGRADVVKRGDGTYVLLFRRGEHHGAVGDASLHLLFSEDEGRTWGPPNRTPDGDPVSGFPHGIDGGSIGYGILERTHGDELVVFVGRKPVSETSTHALDGTGFLRSRDGGSSWSHEGKLRFADHDGDDDGIYPSDSFVHPETGDVYLSTVYYPGNDPENRTQFGLTRSPNGGQDWEFLGLISDDEWNDTGENGIEYLGDDRLLCLGRTTDDTGTLLYRSDDMGETWSGPTDIADQVGVVNKPRLYSEGAITDGLSYTAGGLFVCGRERVVSRSAAQNEHNMVGVSLDGGRTWTQARGQGYGDGAYSGITRRRDGSIYQVGYGGQNNLAPCDLRDLTYDITPELALEITDTATGELLHSVHVPAESGDPVTTLEVGGRDIGVAVVNRSTREVDATAWGEFSYVTS